MNPIKSVVRWAVQKALGPGTWLSPGAGVSYPTSGSPHNWWQLLSSGAHMDYAKVGPVYACIKIISEDMSRIPIEHKKVDDNTNAIVTVTTRAPFRLFRKPNRYQTKSDWILYMLYSLLSEGNSYNLAIRNDRNEVVEFYPLNPKACWPYIEPESGEVFYRLTQDANVQLANRPVIDGSTWVPQRDIMHIRLLCPAHPLVGESPIVSVTYPIVSNAEINKHVADFFHNMGRPSGILRHPGELSGAAMARIKERFKELITGGNTGEPIVLREGMEWTPLTMSAVDSELVQSYQLTERQIAQAFRVPTFLLGDLEKATFNNVESLIRFYLQSCLGFYVDHLEEALTMFLGLPPGELIQFDLEGALLRGDFAERMSGYAKGIQSGVYAPNEARARENLPPVKDGDEPRVQQQLVPLSYGMQVQPKGMEDTSGTEPEEPEDQDTDDQEEPEEDKQVKLSQLTEEEQVAVACTLIREEMKRAA